jgi:hypothetical protein
MPGLDNFLIATVQDEHADTYDSYVWIFLRMPQRWKCCWHSILARTHCINCHWRGEHSGGCPRLRSLLTLMKLRPLSCWFMMVLPMVLLMMIIAFMGTIHYPMPTIFMMWGKASITKVWGGITKWSLDPLHCNVLNYPLTFHRVSKYSGYNWISLLTKTLKWYCWILKLAFFSSNTTNSIS